VALLVGDHGREEFPDGVEVGDDVDVVELLDLLGGDVEDGELAVGDTGVVDQDAGLADGGADLTSDLGDDVGIGNVTLEVRDLS
jgi:hypothetical protein